MNFKIVLATFAFLLAAPTIQASGDHSDGHTHERSINSTQAETRAQSVVDQLVDKKAVDASWKGSKPSDKALKNIDGKKFWQVTFKNAGEADATKQTLYVFLTTGGNYLAANHSGKY